MKKIAGSIILALGLAGAGFGQYYPTVAVKGQVSDGEVVVFSGADGRYVRSSGSTNAGAYMTNLVGTIAAITNDLKNATNSILATISSNQTVQAGTNTELQRQITTNLTLQGQTNTALQGQITDNLSAQGNTNAGFEARIGSNEAALTAQGNTNAGFEARIGSNETFRQTTQPATNAALLAQITNNAALQAATNAGYEARIGSNETFRQTTQPATNAALLAQITNNAALQAATNAGYEARIASNETFRQTTQPATNAALQGQLTALANTNSGFEARIGSNEAALTAQAGTNAAFQTYFNNQNSSNAIFTAFNQTQTNLNAEYEARMATNDAAVLAQQSTNALFQGWFIQQANTNSGFEARIASNEVFRQTTQPATNAELQRQITTNLTLQAQTNTDLQGQIVTNLETHASHTNLSLASGAHGGESDPVWAAASNLYATGTPVYVESDPVWSGVSGSVVYADDAGYTQAVEQASRALEWADAASNLAATAYGWGDHAGKYHVTNTLTFNGTTYTVTNEPDAGYVLKFDASNNVCWFAPDDNTGNTYSGDGVTITKSGNTFSVAPWIPNNLLSLRYEMWNQAASYSQGLIDGPGYWFDDEGGILAAASSNQTWANPGYRNCTSFLHFSEVVGSPEAIFTEHGPGGSASTVWSNKIYCIQVGAGQTNFLSFDGSTWVYETPLEEPHEKCSIAAYGDYIYAVGGYSAATNCYRFNGSVWEGTPGLPAGRHSGAMCEYGGKLYYMGGGTYWLNRQTNVYAFDGDSWTEVEGLPVGDIAQAAVYDGKIYCSCASQSTNIFTFDGTNWTEINGTPGVKCYLGKMISHDDHLLLVRGGHDDGSPKTNIYTFIGDEWVETVGVPVAVCPVGGGSIGDSVYIVAGQVGGSLTNTYRLDFVKLSQAGIAATNTLLPFLPGYAYASALVNVGTNSPTTNEVKLFVSRDYGTNWTEAVCEINDTWAVSNKLVTGTCWMTNQPTCSNTVVKVEISSNMALTVLGLAAPCSPEE